MKYEYMLHIWGEIFNEGCPMEGNPNYYWFDTKEQRDNFISELNKMGKYICVKDISEGYDTRKRTIAVMRFEYKSNFYDIEYDFGYAYPEESAEFMWEEGNDSCDCNRSSYIRLKYPDFPELDCGDEIEMVDFKVEFRD